MSENENQSETNSASKEVSLSDFRETKQAVQDEIQAFVKEKVVELEKTFNVPVSNVTLSASYQMTGKDKGELVFKPVTIIVAV